MERISGLTSEQAKDYILDTVKEEVQHETAVMIKEMESEAKQEQIRRQRKLLLLLYRDVLPTMLPKLQYL